MIRCSLFSGQEDRKTSIDKLLMEYKKIEKDFRYIIRNGEADLEVLMKRPSEMQNLPYRKFPI